MLIDMFVYNFPWVEQVHIVYARFGCAIEASKTSEVSFCESLSFVAMGMEEGFELIKLVSINNIKINLCYDNTTKPPVFLPILVQWNIPTPKSFTFKLSVKN